MKITSATSRIGVCFNCDWRTEDRDSALRDARQHAEKMGHTTSVETAKSKVYRPTVPATGGPDAAA